MQFEERPSFANLDSGEVVSVSRDLLRDEDEELDIPAWQEGEWTLARRIAFHFDRFERLPSKYNVHEWDIMSRFADSVKDRRNCQRVGRGDPRRRCIPHVQEHDSPAQG
jgi:hypothetical protein